VYEICYLVSRGACIFLVSSPVYTGSMPIARCFVSAMESEAHAIARGLEGRADCHFRPCYLFIFRLASQGYCRVPRQSVSAKVPPGMPWLEKFCHSDADLGRQCGVPGAHETPTGQCSRRHFHVLSGDNGMGYARRGDGETSIFDWVALLIPLALGIGLWISALELVHSHTWSS
jgi:hypothetical protein